MIPKGLFFNLDSNNCSSLASQDNTWGLCNAVFPSGVLNRLPSALETPSAAHEATEELENKLFTRCTLACWGCKVSCFTGSPKSSPVSGRNSRLDWLSNSPPRASGSFSGDGGSTSKEAPGRELRGRSVTVTTTVVCSTEILFLPLLPILTFDHLVHIHSRNYPSLHHD